MTSPVTEISILNTNDLMKAEPGLFVELTQFVKDKRIPGTQRQAWGSRVEESENWQWLLDWESVEHYKQSQAFSSSNNDFREKLSTLLVSPPTRILVPFCPSEGYNKALAAPVTESIFITVKDTVDIQTFGELLEAVMTAASSQGCLGWAWGHNTENEKSAAALLGWESIEAHEKFRESDGFRRVTPSLFETISEIKIFHIMFEQQNI